MDEVNTNIEINQGGKIVFADDVVATIAYLAAGEVEGVHAMIGTTMEGLSEKLGKKNYTKGVKVEVGSEECACDVTIIVKYGYRIQAVAQKVQEEIKNAIETMTGLKVGSVEVNIGNGSATPTINGDVYGGSALGSVNSSTQTVNTSLHTNVNLIKGTINGSLY